jgi:hypothetical protein
MIPTFDQGWSDGGVTLVQCPPSSSVRQISPSSVPIQISQSRIGEVPIS